MRRKKATQAAAKPAINIDRKYLFGVLLTIIGIYVFKSFFRPFFLILLFTFVNSILAFVKKFIEIPLEFEAKTLGIVFISKALGMKYVAIFIILAWIFQVILRRRFNIQMFAEVVTDFILAYICIILPIGNIVTLGIIASILNVIFIFIFLQFIFMVPPSVTAIACISNLLFNLILFTSFGQTIAYVVGL